MNKKKRQKVLDVNPRVYYQSLSKKDKGIFLNYLLVNYGICIATVRRKLSKTQFGELSKLEEMTIKDVITKNLWKT